MADEQNTQKRKRRTPEEILAMREALMARRNARAAGEKVVPTGTPLSLSGDEPLLAQEAPPTPKPAPAKVEKAASPPAEKAEVKATPAPVAAKPVVAEKPAPKKAPPKKRPAKKAAPPVPTGPKIVTRREFLNYAWLGSMALLTAQTLGVSVLFLFPNFKAGEFGGLFPIGSADEVLPEIGAAPIPFDEGKFWLTNTDKGVYALYKICTHLGCLYGWVDTTFRFECPCHGSKFTTTGKYIEGPAPTSLDRFVIQAVDANGNIVVQTDDIGRGLPLDKLQGTQLVIDTGKRILVGSKDEV